MASERFKPWQPGKIVLESYKSNKLYTSSPITNEEIRTVEITDSIIRKIMEKGEKR